MSKYWVRIDIKGTNLGKGSGIMPDKNYEILALTMRYWFIGLIIFVVIRIVLETMGTKKGQNYRKISSIRSLFNIKVLTF